MDMSPIKGMPATRPSSDAISGLVAYTAVATVAATVPRGAELSLAASLKKREIEMEVRDLKTIVANLHPAISFDPLGWGLQCWEAQWLPQNQPTQLCREMSPWNQFSDNLILSSAFERITDARHRIGTPFRAYGSWLGARVSGEERLGDAAVRLSREAARAELADATGDSRSSDGGAGGGDGLTGINRVMLASALDPLAFCRRNDEPDILP